MAAYGQSAGGNITNNAPTNNTVNQIHVVPPEPKLHLFPDISIYFHGREEKIKEIHTAVQTCQSQTHSLFKLIVLQAPGGMGKSEIARAYATRYHGDYDYIVWFDAQTETSLKSSFENLGDELDIPFKAIGDIPKLYKQLSTKYNRGLFIFDNAEGLETTNIKQGIEDYLHAKDFLYKKPIYLTTSRNGRDSWGGRRSNIKIVNIGHLSYEETQEYVKKYLQVEGQELPLTLEDSISELAKTLGGFPLALSLVWALAGGIEVNISNDGMKTKIKEFTSNIYTGCDDEEKLKLIFEAAEKSVSKDRNGSVALELLGINGHLNPDGIKLKLVYAIYTGKCYDGKFDNIEIEDQDFTNAVEILMNYSLIKINKEEIKIHRLIQQSARNSTTTKSENKILEFFERNCWNGEWIEHMRTVLDELLDGICVENKTYYLCMMAWKICFECYGGRQLERINSFVNEGTTDEMFMLELAEVTNNLWYHNFIFTPFRLFSSLDIQTGVFKLTKYFLSHGWVVDGCVRFLFQLLSSDSYVVRKKANQLHREAISNWIVQNYMNLLTAGRQVRLDCAFYVLYGFESTRSPKDDKELFWKCVTCTNGRSQDWFWHEIWGCEFRENFVREIFSVCGVDLITVYLQTSNKLGHPMGNYFLDCLFKVFETDGAPKKFAQSLEFVNSFAEAFEFYEINNSRFYKIVKIWLKLFAQDWGIYNTFKKHVEPKFEEFCNSEEEIFYYRKSPEEFLNELIRFCAQLEQTGQQPGWLKRAIEFVQTAKLYFRCGVAF